MSKCQDCGKTFNKGDEGDNEKFCLKCEHKAFIRDCDRRSAYCEDYDIPEDHDAADRLAYESERIDLYRSEM